MRLGQLVTVVRVTPYETYKYTGKVISVKSRSSIDVQLLKENGGGLPVTVNMRRRYDPKARTYFFGFYPPNEQWIVKDDEDNN